MVHWNGIRFAAAAAALTLVPLLSGCVGMGIIDNPAQQDVIGDYKPSVQVCASGTPGCTTLGSSGLAAGDGTGQLLLGVRLTGGASLPPTLASGPVVFTESPSYTAELRRLDPAPAGAHWTGYLSSVVTHSTAPATPHSLLLQLTNHLSQAPDGSPFAPSVSNFVTVGSRLVGADAPADRPVTCGPNLSAVFQETPAAFSYVICRDDFVSVGRSTRDLGILTGATAKASPGGLAGMAFTLKYAGSATPEANFQLSASSALAGATFAVTPGSLAPTTNSTNQAVVAVGVPAGARPGSYKVTLQARVAGQIRTGVGTLTVQGAPAGGIAGRARVTVILPRGLSAAIARRKGIAVLVGSTKRTGAKVQLFQGAGKAGKKAKATKRVLLRSPGPTKVTLRSRKLTKGGYRIVITVAGKASVRRGSLVK